MNVKPVTQNWTPDSTLSINNTWTHQWPERKSYKMWVAKLMKVLTKWQYLGRIFCLGICISCYVILRIIRRNVASSRDALQVWNFTAVFLNIRVLFDKTSCKLGITDDTEEFIASTFRVQGIQGTGIFNSRSTAVHKIEPNFDIFSKSFAVNARHFPAAF